LTSSIPAGLPFGRGEILLAQDDHGEVLLTLESFADNKLLNTVVVVNNGEEVLRYLRREDPHSSACRPELVLLDLRLPRLDGAGVLRSIRKDPTLAGILVAVLGRADLEGELLRQQGLEADAFLDRPVTFERLSNLAGHLPHFELYVTRPETTPG
jgi:chemotaxis family two-component system response regulator Rcp1